MARIRQLGNDLVTIEPSICKFFQRPELILTPTPTPELGCSVNYLSPLPFASQKIADSIDSQLDTAKLYELDQFREATA